MTQSKENFFQIEAFNFEENGCGGVFHIEAICNPLIDDTCPVWVDILRSDVQITVSTKQEVEMESLLLTELCNSKESVLLTCLKDPLTVEEKEAGKKESIIKLSLLIANYDKWAATKC